MLRTSTRGAGSRRRRAAVTGVFFVHGLVFASWAARVPEVRDRLHLLPGVLGLVLAGPGVGALAGSQLGGLLVGWIGSRRVSALAPVLLCLPLGLIPVAGGPGALFLILLLMGIGDGATSVAMSVQSVVVQEAYGRPVINSMHAMRSLGAVAGSLFGAVSASWSPDVQFAVTAACTATLAAAAAPALSPDAPRDPPRESTSRTGQGRAVRSTTVLIGIAAMALLSSLVEDAPASWGGVYLRGTGASAAVAATAYAAFSVGEVTGRLVNDRWVERFGWVRVIRSGTLACAVVLTVTLGLGRPAGTLAALVLAGAGISAVFPGAYATAGTLPNAATAIAQVGFAGNVGWLLVGPLIGAMATVAGLPTALAALPAACLALAGLAGITGAAGHSSHDREAP